MLNRIVVVLLTYVTRPAVWVLGGSYAVAVMIVANRDFSRGTLCSRSHRGRRSQCIR